MVLQHEIFFLIINFVIKQLSSRSFFFLTNHKLPTKHQKKIETNLNLRVTRDTIFE